MVRQENIETASTATSIIPASNADSDYNSTVITAQKNQPKPIYVELISFEISNTLQKAKNLANDQDPDITPQEAPKKVIDVIMEEANQLQKDKEGLQQCIAAQRVPAPGRSVEKLHELLPDCEKIPGPSQHLKVTQWMASIDGKEKHDAFNSRMGKNNPPPPMQVPNTAPVASSSSSNMKKQPQV
ncbi:hypothetical protein O181_030118 [Austropuccinia psidii MF-1]|uniref:Uncharacterized protein n=1 Tax=Austropuccinia psidii MF-1 TaxID=1389203 RepID=A0A9Q3H3D9_9BASI|nr:hypothetical protein [Austropuccinia psidii MF-1]